MFPRALLHCFPLLPREEEWRLNDMSLREYFVGRAFSYCRWSEMLDLEPTPDGLVKFQAAHNVNILQHLMGFFRHRLPIAGKCGLAASSCAAAPHLRLCELRGLCKPAE